MVPNVKVTHQKSCGVFNSTQTCRSVLFSKSPKFSIYFDTFCGNYKNSISLFKSVAHAALVKVLVWNTNLTKCLNVCLVHVKIRNARVF